jgi:DNA-directed RNA polymerase subunit H
VSYLVAPRELIPQHKLLSESEAKKVAKEYGIPFEKFPKILERDPQAQTLNAKAGQLIEINREDPTGKYKHYRYVVTG